MHVVVTVQVQCQATDRQKATVFGLNSEAGQVQHCVLVICSQADHCCTSVRGRDVVMSFPNTAAGWKQHKDEFPRG